MLVVNDSMVLIHLAKITLLEKSCDHFGTVMIPEAVFLESVKTGKTRGFEDAILIESIIKKGKITVKKIGKKEQLKKISQYNIFGGEAEAIALYWQENADLLACDDDNVRKKKGLLDLRLAGTPSIILDLYMAKKIDREKAMLAVSGLRKIGWFSNEVMDKIMMEVEQNG